MKLHPILTHDGRYVPSNSTDIRKTFAAARKKQLREAELRQRRERKQTKGMK